MKTLYMLCRTASLIALLSVVWLACSDDKDNTPTPPTPEIPLVTEAGKPAGPLVKTTIGANGGTLTSTDGLLTVSIPAGALNANTEVSIQPITNNAPLGMGMGYRLLPEGTTFARPATLTFQYNDALLNGTPADFLWITTQATDGSWNAMLKSRVDTNTKTVSVQTTHFSDWVMGRFIELTLVPGSMALPVGKTMALAVTGFSHEKEVGNEELAPLTSVANNGLDVLTPLTTIPPVEARLQEFRVKGWTLNGAAAPVSGKNGSLTANNLAALYTAPATKPSPNTVAVSVELEGNNKEGRTYKYLLTANITIIEGDYYLTVTVDGGDTYTYLQYGFNGQVPTSEAMLTIANAGRSDNTITIGGGTMDNGEMLDAFTLTLENPSEGSKMMGCWHGDDEKSDQDEATFTLLETPYTNAYVQRRITQPGDFCETKYMCSPFVVALTDYSDNASAEVAGHFYGKIYEDHDNYWSECKMPIEHTVSGDFRLIVVN